MSDNAYLRNSTAGVKSRSSGRTNWQQQEQQQSQIRQTIRRGGSYNGSFERIQQRSRKPSGSTYPSRNESRGHVVAVLENFGFIQSVDRMEDIFFHFTELLLDDDNNGTTVDGTPIKVGDKVQFEFKVSRDMKEKAARVRILPPDTILLWDDAVDEEEGIVYQGFIDKLPAGNSAKSYNIVAEFLQSCGTITLNAEDTRINRFVNEIVYFAFDDYSNNGNKKKNQSSNTSRRGNSGNNNKGDSQLSTKDFVEFHLVRNRRTKALFARKIALIQSEKDRLVAAKEEMLLRSSTREKGIVMSLRRNGGYLRSTKHDVPIYFSYEHVILPHNDNQEYDNDYTLREGSFVNFLVVYENLDDNFAAAGANDVLNGGKSANWRTVPIRLSARQVEEVAPDILKEDIKSDKVISFYEAVQCRVHGTVVSLPSFASYVSVQNLPLNDMDLRGSYGVPGKIRLYQKIRADCLINGEQTSSTIEYVDFYPEDAPGGCRMSSYVGSSSGREQQNSEDNLWVCVGDCVLLDIVCESFTYQCKPSNDLGTGSYFINTLPWARFRAHPPLLPDGKRAETLLMERLTLAGRFEGVVLGLKKEAGYGFIKLLHRNLDVYFRTSDVMPAELLLDRVHDNFQGQLKIGAGVSFELSLSFTMQQEENLRCKRVIVLSVPNETASMAPLDCLSNSWYFSHAYHCLRKDVQALVSKRHSNGGGTLEIYYDENVQKFVEEYSPKPQAQPPGEEKVCGMTPFERYPGIASLLDSLSAGIFPGNDIVFPWILPQIETALIVNMAENYGATVDFVDAEGNALAEGSVSALDWPGSGRIHMQMKIVKDDDGIQQAVVIPEVDSSTKQASIYVVPSVVQPIVQKQIRRGKPSKPISLLRFDKNTVAASDGDSFQEGDLVVCDVYQCRLTGQFEAFHMRLLRKAMKDKKIVESVHCVGFIHDIVHARQFGFITWIAIDKATNSAVVKEKVFFHLNDTSAATIGESKLQKGDEVKFLIANTKPKAATGTKKVAVNIERLTPGTLPMLNIASHERNLCQGYVLIEPSHTKLNVLAPQKKSKAVECAPNSGNRWQNVHLYKDMPVDKGLKSFSNIDDGRILLLYQSKDYEGSNENRYDSPLGKKEEINSIPSMQESHATSRHVSYNKTAVLISAGLDSDTPRRGDLVVFSQSSNGVGKGIRVIQKNAAQLIRGILTQLNLIDGTALFVRENLSDKSENLKEYLFPLSEIVSCQPDMLKDMEKVEGILYESNVYGVCRTSDLYLVSAGTQSSDKAQRPRLNLTVKKEIESSGGKIVAQSSMAKGPDYKTRGFADGWTSRKSIFTSNK